MTRWRWKPGQCLRRDADLRLHFGDRTGWQAVEQVPTGDNVTTNIAFGGPSWTAYITLSGKGELIAMDSRAAACR
jgi:hypothetical protein